MNQLIPFIGFHEPISSMTHLCTAVLFLFLGVKLIYRGRGNKTRLISLIIYIVCSVFLFSMSGVYHLLEKGTTGNYVLQILDHAGIYLMISGSITPFQIIMLRGTKRWLPLIVIWIIAITGVTLTSIFFSTMPEWLLLSFFIGMGWMGTITVWFMRHIDRVTVKFIFLGGVLYTVGASADFARWPIILPRIFEAHEIFHIFVSAAALVHLYAIIRISHLPISSKLVVIVNTYPNFLRGKLATENGVFKAKTDEDLRNQVKEWVDINYLAAYKPHKIKLKYFKEDIV